MRRVVKQAYLRSLTNEQLEEFPVNDLCHFVDVAFYGEDHQGTDSVTLTRVMKALNLAVNNSSF